MMIGTSAHELYMPSETGGAIPQDHERGNHRANDGNPEEITMLKPKATTWIFTALAVMAVSGIASASASAAPKWLVRGTALTGSEGITAIFLPIGTTKLVVLLKSKLPGGKVEIIISCAKAAIIGGKITAPNAGSATKLSFKECKLDSKECKLTAAESAEIGTSEVSMETTDLATTEPLFLKLVPKGGTNFFTFRLIECAFEGEFKLTGTMASAITAKATREQTLHLWKFETITLLSTLKYGSEPMSIEMGVSVALINGGNWSSTL
jgi:hypothetical protein